MKEYSYDEIKEYLEVVPMPTIVFEEYDKDGSLILKVEGYEMHTFIKEEEYLERERIEEYYGIDEPVEQHYYSPYIRLILSNPEDEEFKPYPIHLNKPYMNSGYQKIYIMEEEQEAWINHL